VKGYGGMRRGREIWKGGRREKKGERAGKGEGRAQLIYLSSGRRVPSYASV